VIRETMERRGFIAVVAGSLFAAPLTAIAQPTVKSFRIAYLGTSSPSLESHLVEA